MCNPIKPRLNRAFTLIELLVVIAIIAILAAILFPVFGRARENARRSSCQSNLKHLSLGWMQYTQDYDEKAVPTYWQDGPTSNPVYHFFHGTGPYGGPFNYTDAPLWPYMKNSQFTGCPSASYTTAADYGNTDYGYNMCYVGGIGPGATGRGSTRFTGSPNFSKMAIDAVNIAKLEAPSQTILFGDSLQSGVTNGVPYVQRWPWLYPPSIGVGAAATASRHLDTAVVSFVDGHVKSMRLDVIGVTNVGQTRGHITGGDANPLSDALWNGTGQP
ncbi:DUF1559 domain-containing protein [bacterium]|nr:MAG: DUF1559 domain-containing protein [bacterium]